jgi:nucleoside-diphosphate-sugar epimerase
MHVMIIGAAGMLGSKLARRIAAREMQDPFKTTRLTLVDVVEPATPSGTDLAIETMALNLTDIGVATTLAALRPDVVFHLAAVVSGEAEANFAKGYQVNFHATLNLLEAIREFGNNPRVVFSSSLAVYGPPFPEVVPEDFCLRPASSYGVQKAMAEFLIADYTRKGYIDGVTLRLPTIVVRPGAPNAAVSGFLSSIIREPLAGLPAKLPVAAETVVWIASPNTAVEAFVHAAGLSRTDLGDAAVINLPGLSISIDEMLEALQSEAGTDVVARVIPESDPVAASIVKSWPSNLETETADSLGFPRDVDFHQIIRQFMAETSC